MRSARVGDADAIRELHLSAFDASEADVVATLAVDLLSTDSEPGCLLLVAEIENRVAGYIAFSPLWSATGHELIAYLLGPLAVAQEHQNQGIGSALIREGLKRLEEQAVEHVLVYGDPAYYGRFGFEAESASPFLPPYPLKYDFGWLGLEIVSAKPQEADIAIECVEPLNKPELW